MNLSALKQFGIVWLFQYVGVMTWVGKFTETFSVFCFHGIIQGIIVG